MQSMRRRRIGSRLSNFTETVYFLALTAVILCLAVMLYEGRKTEAEPVLLEGWIDQEPTRKWSVKQNDVPRYTATYDRVDDTFIITNRITGVTPLPSPTVPPKPSQKPDQLWPTGQLWWPVPVLIAGSLGVLVAGLVLSRKSGATPTTVISTPVITLARDISFVRS